MHALLQEYVVDVSITNKGSNERTLIPNISPFAEIFEKTAPI